MEVLGGMSEKQIPRGALRNDKQMQMREADSSRKGALRMTLRKLVVMGEIVAGVSGKQIPRAALRNDRQRREADSSLRSR